MNLSKTLKVKNKLGIHARPAALIVRTAGRFKCDIKIAKGDNEVNCKSMMGVLTLAAEHGAEITISANGHDAAEAMKALENLFEHELIEEDEKKR